MMTTPLLVAVHHSVLLSTGLALGLFSVDLGLHIIVLSCLYAMVNNIFRPYMPQLVWIPRCLAVYTVAVAAGVVVFGS